MANVTIEVLPKQSDSEDIWWANKFNQDVNASTNPQIGILDGMTLVLVENTANGAYMQHCTGVDIALDLVRKDPNKKILLSSWLPIEFLKKQKPEVDILLKRETVRFIRPPYTIDEIISIWEKPSAVEVSLEGISKYNQRQIGIILHGMRVADPKQPQNNGEQAMVHDAIAETKKLFPSLVAASDDEVLDFLFEASNGRPLVRQGEKLDGVFCDIDGTLIVNGNINEKTLSVLKQYEAEGKQITLWTDGNKETTSVLLANLGVSYPLMAKMDYAGAEVEIALDDFDEFAFNARTKITARTFIQVV